MSLERMYEAKREYDRVKKYYEDVRKKEQLVISNYMFSHLQDANQFDIVLDEGPSFYGNKKSFSVSRVRKKKVVWNVEALKKAIPKNLVKKAINRKIVIDDFQGLVKYLKSCGVDPAIFKTFLSTEETVNEEGLNKMYELGEVEERQLKGCYTVEFGDFYIRMTEKKDDKKI